MPITKSIVVPLAAVTSSIRHAIAPRIISVGGYHLNGNATTSALYPASTSARCKPATCDSAPPLVKGTWVVQIRMLRSMKRRRSEVGDQRSESDAVLMIAAIGLPTSDLRPPISDP